MSDPGDDHEVEVQVVGHDEALSLLAGDEWASASVALTRSRLASATADPRWEADYVVAVADGEAVGVLPVYRAGVAGIADPWYDPAAIVPDVTGPRAADARRWAFLGGRRDLASGVLTLARLDDETRAVVAHSLARRAFDHAGGEGLRGVALYVRDDEVRAVAAGAGPQAIVWECGEAASLNVPGDEGGYLRSLPSSRRSIVVRDWRRLDERGLRADQVEWDEVLDEAGPLVCEVKTRHAVADHPALVARRLREWLEGPEYVCVAFALRDSQRRLVAVSFSFRRGKTMEMYELGLAGDVPDRHLAYVEVLLYAPLRYALRWGCTRIHLGLESPVPKVLRGAELAPVWGIARRAG